MDPCLACWIQATKDIPVFSDDVIDPPYKAGNVRVDIIVVSCAAVVRAELFVSPAIDLVTAFFAKTFVISHFPEVL